MSQSSIKMLVAVTVSLGLLVVTSLSDNVSAARLHGSPQEIDIENAIIDEVAHFAVANHPGETLEEGYLDALEKVLSAKKQVVAGTLYTLELSVGSSGCSLKSQNDRQLCKIKASSKSRQCRAQVYVQLWMKPQNTVTHWECH